MVQGLHTMVDTALEITDAPAQIADALATDGAQAGGDAKSPRRPSAALREKVFEKSKDAAGTPRCAYCNRQISREPGKSSSFEADHKTPYARGGKTNEPNLAPSCRDCNRQKGAKTVEEFKPQ